HRGIRRSRRCTASLPESSPNHRLACPYSPSTLHCASARLSHRPPNTAWRAGVHSLRVPPDPVRLRGLLNPTLRRSVPLAWRRPTLLPALAVDRCPLGSSPARRRHPSYG